MWIEYKGTKARRDVREAVAKELIKRGIASAVVETRQMTADPEPQAEEVEISERTGKPKRQYKRRDMQAED